jgi:hypothetical protein
LPAFSIALLGAYGGPDVRDRSNPNTGSILEYETKRQGEPDQPREARLRAASAHLYPGVTPDVWIQATTLADIVWARRLQHGAGSLAERVLDGAHFEFRYEGMPPADATLRRRATDRLRLQGD